MLNVPLRILVVDDEELIRDLLRLCLMKVGHFVEAVGNKNDALRRAESRSFDLVITDILMPDGDGLELIAELKVVRPAVRILAISGGGRYLEGQNCLDIALGFGAHASLVKPFACGQLLAAVEHALEPVSRS